MAVMDTTPPEAVRRHLLGRLDPALDHRIHPHPQQVAGLRPGVGRARLHGRRRQADGGLGARRSSAAFAGATLEVVRLPGRTPLIFIEVPGDSDDTVLLYGHLDKQPEMKGWAEGMGPWMPVRKGDKLYGRGGADDGYAMYGCLVRAAGAARAERAARALRHHDRGLRGIAAATTCRSMSITCRPHRQAVAGRLPRFGLRRLRAAVAHDLAARHRRRHADRARAERRRAFGRCVGHRAVELPHPRGLLSRLEDEATGEIRLPDLYVQIPPQRIEQAKEAARVLGEQVYAKFPFAGIDAADGRRSRPAGAEPHLAAAARGDRHGRLSRAGRCRQRAAALLDGQAQPAHAADARRQGRRCRR